MVSAKNQLNFSIKKQTNKQTNKQTKNKKLLFKQFYADVTSSKKLETFFENMLYLMGKNFTKRSGILCYY